MGFGDVTLMGMIGAFLGWQAAVLTFFLAPFFGLAHAVWKLLKLSEKMAERRPIIQRRSRNPFWALPEHGGGDPALSLALALAGLGRGVSSSTLYVIFWWVLGIDVDLPGLTRRDRAVPRGPASSGRSPLSRVGTQRSIRSPRRS